MLRGGGKKTLAHEGGDLAARAAGKLGLKAVGKGALRAIPWSAQWLEVFMMR